MKEKKVWGTLTFGLLVLGGCSGHTLDPIGGGPSAGSPPVAEAGGSFGLGGAGGYVAGAGNPAAGAAPVVPIVIPSELAGTWTGYVENYAFSDASDAVTVVLDEDGQITFGSSPTPAPATDPDRNYPIESKGTGGGQGYIPQVGPVPGFSFKIETLSAEGTRLQFDADINQPWAQWCQLQTPVPDDTNPGNYMCIHNWSSMGGPDCALMDPASMAWVSIDCGKLDLCRPSGKCACTAEGCSVRPAGAVHFDLNVEGSKASGSIAGLDVNLHNVHLTRD